MEKGKKTNENEKFDDSETRDGNNRGLGRKRASATSLGTNFINPLFMKIGFPTGFR